MSFSTIVTIPFFHRTFSIKRDNMYTNKSYLRQEAFALLDVHRSNLSIEKQSSSCSLPIYGGR